MATQLDRIRKLAQDAENGVPGAAEEFQREIQEDFFIAQNVHAMIYVAAQQGHTRADFLEQVNAGIEGGRSSAGVTGPIAEDPLATKVFECVDSLWPADVDSAQGALDRIDARLAEMREGQENS